jgi:hypothetical protein
MRREERGLRVDVLGLYALLSNPPNTFAEGQHVDVRITRMDPDEGRIFVVASGPPAEQITLPLT